MNNVGVRFSGSRYINIEMDPTTKKVTITADLDGTAVAGSVTLTAAKAAKMESK